MTAIEALRIVVMMLGGLALFLFGMETMSGSLEKLTGGVLSRVIGFVTRNKYTAFLFGTGLTALLQSSSAITVLSVGLVNAGIIKIGQAFGLIVGANLGTTATAWLLSLNGLSNTSLLMMLFRPATFAPFMAIISVGIRIFAHSERVKTIASSTLGFAVMMIGMNLMSEGVAPLRNLPELRELLMQFSNPFLGYLFAMLFTMLIQSSDATIGILQALAISVSVSFGSAIPLICGAHMGTCITAILSSMGISNNAKRTALMNLLYNLFKTIPFLLVFYLLNNFLHFPFLQEEVGVIGIPLVHTLINLLAAAIYLPGSRPIISLANRLIPMSSEEKEERENALTVLDPILVSNPSIALQGADSAICDLGDTVAETFELMSRLEPEAESRNRARMLCKRAESYHKQIEKYLTEISSHHMQEKDSEVHSILIAANLAFGQMGEITQRAMDRLDDQHLWDIPNSAAVRKEVRVFLDAINELIGITATQYRQKTVSLSYTVQVFSEEIPNIISQTVMTHIRHIHDNGNSHALIEMLLSIMHAEESLVDCCDMVATETNRFSMLKGDKKKTLPGEAEEKRNEIRKLLHDKWKLLPMD